METACDPVLNIDVPLIVDAGQGRIGLRRTKRLLVRAG